MIGIFDSGVGGLTVLRHLRGLLPSADLLYVGDQRHAPYGGRPPGEVRELATGITGELVAEGCAVVVVACNAASAAALHHLRAVFPGTRFVGMEPAVKPAASITRRGIVGVMTTRVTAGGELLASVVARHAEGVRVVTRACDGWVELVEAGEVAGPAAEEAVDRHVDPLLAAGADTLVLACTHFPFLAPLIGRRAGPSVTIVDPGSAVAAQAARTAVSAGVATGSGRLDLRSTGGTSQATGLAARLAGLEVAHHAVTFPSA